MEHTDFARMGGKARWAGVSAKKRKEAMKKVTEARLKKISTTPLDEQAREV